jgi:hypothetical protein
MSPLWNSTNTTNPTNLTTSKIFTASTTNTATSSANPSTATTMADLPCQNYEDPHANIKPFCTCNNGVSTAIAPSSGSNTGAAYKLCPWTVAPSTSSASKTATSANTQITPPVEYPFTKTLIGMVEECKSSTRRVINTQTITGCAGDSMTISTPQTLSVEKGQNSVSVGQLTGAPLYTSLSNAMSSLCPTPVPSAYTSCNTGKAYIKDVEWVSGDQGLVKGELGVEIESSSYDDPVTLNGMIKAAANTFMSSANSSNCYNAS